ncbi:MAG: SIS domain-containing protein [Rhodoglobus sp.]
MTITETEIASQPAVWRQALELAPAVAALLAVKSERVLIIGCGTSEFIAESIAVLRERAGFGVTDAAYASELTPWRDYDRVVAITRSGTTTEVLDALRSVPAGIRRTAITGVVDGPVHDLADDVIVFDFADEKSVVQTRFPTALLIAIRAAFGEDVAGVPGEADDALAEPLPIDAASFDHFVYLGTGWTYGLAQEAALKIREAAQAWSESYPLLDFRHGPLAVAHEGSLVWMLGSSDSDLVAQIEATGATVLTSTRDPLVELLQAQRLAVEVAALRGLNPDAPRHLTRSIILT